MKQCMYCGFSVDESMRICPNCGAPLIHKKPVDEVNPTNTGNQGTTSDTNPPQPKKKKKLIIVVAVVAFLIFALSMCSGGSSDEPDEPDFLTIYNTYLSYTYASVASDGSYLSIDTNPMDIDDYSNDEAITGLVVTLDELGIPDSVLRKMSETSALDGRLTEEYNGIEISWKYHPDNGLEVLFTKS